MIRTRWYKLCLILIFLCSAARAEELVTGFDKDKDLPVLNEELRKKDVEILALKDRVTTLEAVPAVVQKIAQVVNYQRQDRLECTGNIPDDNTKPQITEGSEVLTLAITPTSATSNLKIDVVTNTDAGGSYESYVALFVVGTADALACSAHFALTNYPVTQAFTYFVAASSTTARTYKVRIGCETGSIWLNGFASSAKLGSTIISSITITEITP